MPHKATLHGQGRQLEPLWPPPWMDGEHTLGLGACLCKHAVSVPHVWAQQMQQGLKAYIWKGSVESTVCKNAPNGLKTYASTEAKLKEKELWETTRNMLPSILDPQNLPCISVTECPLPKKAAATSLSWFCWCWLHLLCNQGAHAKQTCGHMATVRHCTRASIDRLCLCNTALLYSNMVRLSEG